MNININQLIIHNTGTDGAVVNGLVGTGFVSRYWRVFKGPMG